MSLNDSVSDSGPSLSDIEHVSTVGSGNTAAGFNGYPSELDRLVWSGRSDPPDAARAMGAAVRERVAGA